MTYIINSTLDDFSIWLQFYIGVENFTTTNKLVHICVL